MRALLLSLATLGFLVPAVPALAQTASTQASGGEQEKMVCRKFLETGSLVKKRKICMTKSEWQRVQISQREGSEKMVQELSGGFRCEASNIGC